MDNAHVIDSITKPVVDCYHCGEPCIEKNIQIENKKFCCEGCKTVFEILNQSDLCEYYRIEQTPGTKKINEHQENRFAYLDNDDIIRKLIDFSDERITKITFDLPQIHCASCIWLLEKLYKLHQGINQAKVNFPKRQLSLSFSNEQLSLRQVVELLYSLGYEPTINLSSLNTATQKKSNKTLLYKLGIAGFCFGNIMLLSFPEYLAIDDYIKPELQKFFGYLNLVLALPVFFYCSSSYFSSAIVGLKTKMLNIDVPISLGIITLFLRSIFDIISQTGSGYFDSMTGLVFFLLIGKWIQNKTYERLSFDRDYKAYFPVSVIKLINGKEQSIVVSDLKIGDEILIKNQELIPADCVLVKGESNIDYSFVTGESGLVKVNQLQTIYAGGKQVGGALQLKVIRSTSQSYLTQLWDNSIFKKDDSESLNSLVNRVSQYFTPTVLIIAFVAGGYWYFVNPALVITAFTSVLIIACPCALALTTPFTLGNSLRIFGKHKIFLKNIAVIERMAGITNIVFDKTGTLTTAGMQPIKYNGTSLLPEEKSWIKSLAHQSSHPLSKKIVQHLEGALEVVSDFKEISGKGLEGKVMGQKIRLGSKEFIEIDKQTDNLSTQSWVAINGEVKGCFNFYNYYREDLDILLTQLKKKYTLSLLSGDNDNERKTLVKFFNSEELYFNQTPTEKLEFIQKLQENGKKVLMIGDGLNDAGALQQSDVGISISEDTNNFSPACDAILDASSFGKLNQFLVFGKRSLYIVWVGFIISFLYNIFGLFFAVQGILSPVIAAILMPLSSITVVVFGWIGTEIMSWRRQLDKL